MFGTMTNLLVYCELSGPAKFAKLQNLVTVSTTMDV